MLDKRYRSTPNKNEHSHVGDAAGCARRFGEHKDMEKETQCCKNATAKSKGIGL